MKTKDEIKQIVALELKNAIGVEGSELVGNRAEAMKYYLCEPRGDEIKGRSQVISSDVADVVEWIKPQVIKAFIASDKIAEFDPVGPEDQEQAEQESDYTNYVVMKDNEAFVIFTSLISDCLLQKNGYVKVFWEDPSQEREEYEGLSDVDTMMLLDDPHIELVSYEQREDPVPLEMVSDIVLLRESFPGKVQIDPVPPEELRIARGHNAVSLAKARFVAHVRDIPASDLVEKGYPQDIIDELPTAGEDFDDQRMARHQVDRGLDETEAGDMSMRLIRVAECYVKLDMDGDGIAELRQVIYAGDQILEDPDAGEPGSPDAIAPQVDRIPFASATPIFQPHIHNGLSFYDRIKQIQDEKTALKRQLLDNLYLLNNQRTYVNLGAGINFNDLLTNRPGGIVRGSTIYADAMSPIPTPALPPQSFEMLGYLDREREERSGVGPNAAAQAMQVANDTAHGIERLMSAKELLVEMVIRTIAETGVKEMFGLVRELLMKHQDKAKVVELRGKWVNVNPSEWRKRMNTTMKVGLGTGDRMKKQATLQQIMMLQEKLLAGGKEGILVDDAKLFQTLEEFARNGDLFAERYFLDPDSNQVKTYKDAMSKQKPQPDPQIEAINAQLQIEQMRTQRQTMKDANDAQLKQAELKLKAQELMLKLRDQAIDERQIASKEAIEAAKLEVQALQNAIVIDIGQPGIGAGLNG